MLERYLGLIVLIILILLVTYIKPAESSILGQTQQQRIDSLQPIQTQSKFEEKLESQTEPIFRKTIHKDDPETEAGEEKVINEGKDGSKLKIIKITFYEGEQYSQAVISTEIVPPQDKVILRGTKIVWKILDSPDGQIRYFRKLRVWATHYDSRCLGCNEWTATGMRAGKGVIAVDPKVIPLKSRGYIPGYGIAVAGDTGGAIKGNIIDLGFDDAKTAGWTARFVDIYLI